jgi:hypothetical protein
LPPFIITVRLLPVFSLLFLLFEFPELFVFDVVGHAAGAVVSVRLG